jgi:hypothetical protein
VIYDERIAQNDAVFNSVMFAINFGCFVFCLPLIINLRKNMTSRISRNNHYGKDKDVALLSLALILGWVSTIIEFTPLKNPISKSLVLLLPISLSATLWQALKPVEEKKRFALLIVFGSLGVVILASVNNNSKGFILTPIVVAISSLKIWRRGSLFTKIFALIIVLFGTIPLFEILQRNKLGSNEILIASSYQEQLPWYLSPFLVISQRFDQFARVVDAQMAASNSLGGFRGWVDYFASALQWNPSSGRNDASFGQIWNQLITSQSIPGAQLSRVSLAQGMIAEGLIWGGLLSLVIECLVFSIIFIAIGNMLDGKMFGVVSAFCLISNATIFETGTVGFGSILNSASKILPFLFFAYRLMLRLSGDRDRI